MMEQALPPSLVIRQMVTARLFAQAIGTATRFGFADLLASGPKTVEELGEATGTLASSVHRLLRALAGSGIFVEVEPRRFANTPLSDVLRVGVPGSVHGMVQFLTSETHIRAWFGLDHSIRTGTSAFSHVHGKSLWDHFKEDATLAELFHKTMSDMTSHVAGSVAQKYDFSGINTLVDVGGGHGALLNRILTEHKGLRGILFDLPEVVAQQTLLRDHTVAGRTEVVGGDFFQTVPGADAYILKQILHDWGDEEALAILRTIAGQAKPGCKVLLVELLIKPGNDYDPAKRADLEMLVINEGGRERSELEYAELFQKAGLTHTRTIPVALEMHIIEAVRG